MFALRKGLRGRFARALLALVAMALAFGPPLDTAGHAASNAVAAGDSSVFMKVLSAFDVLDDPFDHLPGDRPADKTQMVVQLALPDLTEAPAGLIAERRTEAWPARRDIWSSRLPPPLERPPRA